MSLLSSLEERKLITPPKWLTPNTMQLSVIGSMAFGCNEDDSDQDIYGFCIPPKEDIFPHLRGEIFGFGNQQKRFEQWLQHGVFDQSARKGRGQEYDFTVYSIVKYFQLCMDNNPTMLDSLFTSRECVIHSTKVGEMVRERKKIFLSKKAFHTCKGYAYQQLSKIANQRYQVTAIRGFEEEHGIPHNTKFETIALEYGVRPINPLGGPLDYLSDSALAEYEKLWVAGLEGDEGRQGSKRFYSRKRWGYDLKFAMHLVRLVQECEQILTVGDIDLRRDAAMYRDIREGNWTEAQVREWFTRREAELSKLYTESKAVPHKPDEAAIKKLLLECLEEHYGSLHDCVVIQNDYTQALRDIKKIIERTDIC